MKTWSLTKHNSIVIFTFHFRNQFTAAIGGHYCFQFTTNGETASTASGESAWRVDGSATRTEISLPHRSADDDRSRMM